MGKKVTESVDLEKLKIKLLGKIATDSQDSVQARAKELFEYGFTTGEVANILGITSGTASTYKSRAKGR